MMARLLIIADDLSGAAETAVQIVRRGVPAVVTMNPGSADLMASGAASPVVAVDTETRHASPATAAQRVKTLVCEAQGGGFTHFYKKTDSTLRGNIGAELAALMEATGRQYLVFVPAYPRAGRYTRNGLQYVGSQLLHESVIALDPLEPVTTSSVAEIIERQADVTAVSVRPETLGASISKQPTGVVVCDAASDDDMAEIAAVLERHGALRFIAGPAAFAGYIADKLNLPIASPVTPCLDTALLIVNGSLHERSLSQVAYALERGAYGIPVPPQIALSECIDGFMPALRTQADKGGGRDVIVYTVLDRQQHADYLKHGMERGLSPREAHKQISRNLALIGAALACGLGHPVLCAFGGDVAIELLRASGCDGLQPLAEGSPGVVLSHMRGGRNKRYFVTKPGGFGSDRVVEDIRILLRGAGAPPAE